MILGITLSVPLVGPQLESESQPFKVSQMFDNRITTKPYLVGSEGRATPWAIVHVYRGFKSWADVKSVMLFPFAGQNFRVALAILQILPSFQ